MTQTLEKKASRKKMHLLIRYLVPCVHTVKRELSVGYCLSFKISEHSEEPSRCMCVSREFIKKTHFSKEQINASLPHSWSGSASRMRKTH